MSLLLKGVAGGEMTEGKKYIPVTLEVYEMLLIKAETPVNLTGSTTLEFLKKEIFNCRKKS